MDPPVVAAYAPPARAAISATAHSRIARTPGARVTIWNICSSFGSRSSCQSGAEPVCEPLDQPEDVDVALGVRGDRPARADPLRPAFDLEPAPHLRSGGESRENHVDRRRAS